jgi:sialate O-acetylesterase
VQLAPYNYSQKLVGAALRDAQRKSLDITNTGMVVTLDIGNPDDVHPKNKKDVGKRLSLWALAKTYNKENIVYSGPIYKSMKIEDNKIRISFNHIGSGLYCKGDKLTYFTIAGSDKVFHPANALIENNTVLVSSDDVKNPVAVRFAFANTDEPNLFNKEGLPASTFRTDEWNIITLPKQ